MNVTEYLEQLFATGIQPGDLPVIQPLFQQRIWEQMKPGDGPERLADVIEQLRREDNRFHVEGGSWTNDISWVRGYDHVLIPMEQASALFHERVLARGVPSRRPPLPQRPVPPAGGRDQLLPLLGPGRSGPTTAPSCPAVPPTSSPRTLSGRRSLRGRLA